MAGEPNITIVGNLTGDAELRFTPSGAAVANFTVAVTPRVKDGDQWVDGDTTFFRCGAWRQMAENVAETLTKGTRVVVSGRLKTRQYEANGEKRTSIEIDVDEVGPSLRYASAKVHKIERGDSSNNGGGGFGGGGRGGGGGGFGGPSQQQQRPAADPWATNGGDEPPF